MPADDFTPALPPSLQLRKTISLRVKNAGFGDGYVQRAQDGINAATRSYDLSWNALTKTQADAIENFFLSKAGYLSFLYTAPDDVQRRYTTGNSITRTQSHGKSDSLTVTLTEVHDP